MQLPTSQLARRAACLALVRRRTIVIACAVIPWAVTIVRSWPSSEDEPRARIAARRAADAWRFDGCPIELGSELHDRPFWTMRAYPAPRGTSFLVTARAHRDHDADEWLLEPAQRAALLENLRAQCAAGTVERLPDSHALPLEDPVLVFTPDTSTYVIVELGQMTLRFPRYGATAR